MAAEGEAKQDAVSHARGYEGFVGLMKWGAIISFIVGLMVVFIIAE